MSNNRPGEIRMPSVPEFAQAKQRSEESKAESATLRVIGTPPGLPETSTLAFVSPECSVAAPLTARLRRDGQAFVFCHGYPHFVTRLACHVAVPPGCIVLSEVQRVNVHCCVDEPYEWTLFEGKEEKPLVDLTLEVRPRFPPDQPLRLPGNKLVSELGKSLFGLIVTENELFLVDVDRAIGEAVDTHAQLVARAVSMTSGGGGPAEDGEAGADASAEDEELTLPDHFRGLVDADTQIYVRVDDVAETQLVVSNLRVKEAAPPPRGIVDVTTGDGEWFPVKRKLLRPCIALTSAVMAGAGVHNAAAPEAQVAPDCCTFDRVLLFLEAQAKNLPFDILPEHLDDMAKAADDLRLQGLKDVCDAKRGAFASRVRREPIPFAEVVTRNEAGEVLLLMDGMVLDVTRWLDEHPGGSTIIPDQALNVDSTVFFEIFHVSRQSFLYLKEFYIGELALTDRPQVPKPNDGEASAAFLEQLRVHTTWRVDLEHEQAKAHKSF